MISPAVQKILEKLRANHDEAVLLRIELEEAVSAGQPSPVVGRYGPRPKEATKEDIAKCLENPANLSFTFVWGNTLQRDLFWADQNRAKKLSDEGRAILESWLVE